MASAQKKLEADLYGIVLVFDELERVIAPGGGATVISSIAGYMPGRFLLINGLSVRTPAGLTIFLKDLMVVVQLL
jgi:hypothetical protein